MKRYLIISIAIFAIIITFIAAKENKKNIPPGINPEAWVQINENYGFVITKINEPKTNALGIKLKTLNNLSGFFMLKRDNRWYRIYQESPPVRIEPLKK